MVSWWVDASLWCSVLKPFWLILGRLLGRVRQRKEMDAIGDLLASICVPFEFFKLIYLLCCGPHSLTSSARRSMRDKGAGRRRNQICIELGSPLIPSAPLDNRAQEKALVCSNSSKSLDAYCQHNYSSKQLIELNNHQHMETWQISQNGRYQAYLLLVVLSRLAVQEYQQMSNACVCVWSKEKWTRF